jgi:cell division protein FtsB
MLSFMHHHYLNSAAKGFLGAALLLYSGWHLLAGSRGVLTLDVLQKELHLKQEQLKTLTLQQQHLEHRIALMQPGQVREEMLDELARQQLGYVEPDEIVVPLNE